MIKTIEPIKTRVSPTKVEDTSLFSLFYKFKELKKELFDRLEEKFKHVDELSTEAKQASKEVDRISKQIEKDFEELSSEIVDTLRTIKSKTLKGDKGDAGYTPKKGIDYFDGKNGETPKIDVNKIAKLASSLVKVPKPDTKIIKEEVDPEELAKKLQISIKNIKDWKDTWNEIKREISRNKGGYHGGGFNNIANSVGNVSTGLDTLKFTGSGVSSVTQTGRTVTVDIAGGTGLTKLTVTGTIDDSNVTFTTSSVPVYMIINGSMYASGDTSGGIVMWTAVGTTVTLAFPVGSGGAISAMG